MQRTANRNRLGHASTNHVRIVIQSAVNFERKLDKFRRLKPPCLCGFACATARAAFASQMRVSHLSKFSMFQAL